VLSFRRLAAAPEEGGPFSALRMFPIICACSAAAMTAAEGGARAGRPPAPVFELPAMADAADDEELVGGPAGEGRRGGGGEADGARGAEEAATEDDSDEEKEEEEEEVFDAFAPMRPEDEENDALERAGAAMAMWLGATCCAAAVPSAVEATGPEPADPPLRGNIALWLSLPLERGPDGVILAPPTRNGTSSASDAPARGNGAGGERLGWRIAASAAVGVP
jgi:hypothetical protein